jgi:hypothetical protein
MARKTARIIRLDRSAKYFPRIPAIVFDVEGVIYTEIEIFLADISEGVDDRGIDTNGFLYFLKKRNKELYFWDGHILIPMYMGIICAEAANIKPAFMDFYRDFYENVYKTPKAVFGCHFGTNHIVEYAFNLSRVAHNKECLNFAEIESMQLATAEITPFSFKFNWKLQLYSLKRKIKERIEYILEEINSFFWNITHPEEPT